MLAKDLIDRLERLGLLDQEIIEALRQQLDQAGARVTPEAVAKLLVDNGQLTSFQASKLIGELRSSQYEDEGGVMVEEDSLTDGVVEIVEEADNVAEAEIDAFPVEVEAIEVEAVPVEMVPGDGGLMEAVAMGDGTVPERPQSRRRKPDPQKSTWDSFKIYGYLGIIALLLLLGGGLWFILGRENADAVIQNANEAYDQQAYEAAQTRYIGFLDSFDQEHEYASLARTRIVMTQLYKAATFKQKPQEAVEKAKELLPTIKDEEGMNEERTNLAQLLVDIADNITTQAGKATETTKKEKLLNTLDDHQVLLDNPQYMSSTARVTLASQIAAIQEARERVQRDINRNKRLDATEIAMKGFLEERKTKDAYDARTELLRDFPELYDHERLTMLIEQASEIQQTLVRQSNQEPEVTSAIPPKDSAISIVLTSLRGEEAPDLRGETLYLRAGGSVLAFDGMTGELKWRKFVGYAKDLPPVGVEEGLGVLLSDSAALEVIRCDAESGKKLWRSRVGETFHKPVAAKNAVFVTTDSGKLISLQTDSGEPNWATEIPQPLEVGPGVDSRTRLLYQAGNHSNLYLLNGRDGSCSESYYIGHNEGTIAVPPVPLFGHLFVIENAGSDYAIVHILRIDEDGKNVRVAQDQIRVIGNVHVPPIVQNRRLIVLTDLGEVKVFDVDPNAEGSQVSVVARLPPFYDRPTATQMAVSGTSMWISGMRIGRYQLQINTGRVVRTWSKHELDQFIGQPFTGDDTLIHSRILRDTSAIRVTATDQKTGDEIWRTDVGVPIAMLQPAQGGVIHAITTQGALFEIDRKAITSGSTKPPLEDISDRNVAIRFTDPVSLEKNRVALLDAAGGESFLIYDPNRPKEKLREISMRLPSGKPSGHMAYAGKGLFMPLDNGRAMLLNWQTGAVLAAPFQPASDPATKVMWTTPAQVADDPDQIVMANNRKKLYRLRVNEQISELASEDITSEFLGPAARTGSTYFATASGPATDQLVGHEMNSLDQKFSKTLPGRVLWGPIAGPANCLLQTDDGKLRAFDEDGNEVFTTSLPPGKPTGKPILANGQLIVAGQSGWFVAIDPSSGALIGQDDLGQPISATPIPIKNRLLIPGAEGVIYVAEIPSKVAKIRMSAKRQPAAPTTNVALLEGTGN